MHEEHTYTSPYIAHAYIKIRWPSILRHSLEDPHTHTLAILFGYSSRGRCASVYPCMLYGYSTRAQRLCIYTHIQNICNCVCVCAFNWVGETRKKNIATFVVALKNFARHHLLCRNRLSIPLSPPCTYFGQTKKRWATAGVG